MPMPRFLMFPWGEVRKSLVVFGVVLFALGFLVQFYSPLSPIDRAFVAGLTPAGGITLLAAELYAANDRHQAKTRNQELRAELNRVKIRPLVVAQCSAWMLGYYLVMCHMGLHQWKSIDIAERACQYARDLGLGDEDLYGVIRALPRQMQDDSAATADKVWPQVRIQITSRLVDPTLQQCYDVSFQTAILYDGVKHGLEQDLAEKHANVLEKIGNLHPKHTRDNDILGETLVKLKSYVATLALLNSNVDLVPGLLASVETRLESFMGFQA